MKKLFLIATLAFLQSGHIHPSNTVSEQTEDKHTELTKKILKIADYLVENVVDFNEDGSSESLNFDLEDGSKVMGMKRDNVWYVQYLSENRTRPANVSEIHTIKIKLKALFVTYILLKLKESRGV